MAIFEGQKHKKQRGYPLDPNDSGIRDLVVLDTRVVTHRYLTKHHTSDSNWYGKGIPFDFEEFFWKLGRRSRIWIWECYHNYFILTQLEVRKEICSRFTITRIKQNSSIQKYILLGTQSEHGNQHFKCQFWNFRLKIM